MFAMSVIFSSSNFYYVYLCFFGLIWLFCVASPTAYIFWVDIVIGNIHIYTKNIYSSNIDDVKMLNFPIFRFDTQLNWKIKNRVNDIFTLVWCLADWKQQQNFKTNDQTNETAHRCIEYIYLYAYMYVYIEKKMRSFFSSQRKKRRQ